MGAASAPSLPLASRNRANAKPNSASALATVVALCTRELNVTDNTLVMVTTAMTAMVMRYSWS